MRRSNGADAESTAVRSLLLFAIAAGLALRIVVLVVLGTSHSPTYEFGILGNNIAEGKGFTYFAAFPGLGVLPAVDRGNGFEPAADYGPRTPTVAGTPQPGAYMPPVYPTIAAAADTATTNPSSQIRILQVLNLALFVVLALVVFQLGSTLLGPRVGAVAALGVAAYPSLVYMTSQVSASNLYLPAQVAMLLLAVRLVRRPTDKRLAIATGATAGLVGLLRPEGLALVAVVAIVMLIALTRAGETRRRAVGTVMVLLAATTLLPGAWLVRNSVTFGKPTFTISSQAGFLLWAGNHEGATGSGKTFTTGAEAQAGERRLVSRVQLLPPGPTYELRRDAVFRHEAVTWIRDHPVDAAAGLAKKAFLFVVVDPDDRRSLNVPYLISWALLAALASIGVRRLRPRGPEWQLVAGYIAITSLVPVLLVVLPRYRLPVDVVLLVPAAWFVTERPWFARQWDRRVAQGA
ncbi:MAG: hypothetical protein QOH79_3753 [Acidimicrobiaceae bacterium]